MRARRGRLERASASGAGLALIGMVLIALTGCVGGDPAPQPAPTTSATEEPVETTTEAALVPGGSASDNLPFFDQVNRATLAADPNAGGQAVTSALRDAGFAIDQMQVTVDTTTVGVEADSLLWSVRWGDECLIGQYGFGTYTGTVVPVLGTGKCLVGQTRAIDW